MMHNMIQPRRSPRPWRKHISTEAFREHASTAQDSTAVETTSKNHHANRTTCDRQISQMPAIAAMDPRGLRAATRTGAHHSRRAYHDESTSLIARCFINDKAARHKCGGLERGLHRIDSFRGPTPDTRSTPPKVSQSQYSMPIDTAPLIWSPKAAYLLQIGPKKGKKPWLRLDINPEGLTQQGMAHLADKLDHLFGVAWSTWRFARVSRIDVAIDLHGVALTDWVWDIANRRSRDIVCREGDVRTLYLGAKRANPLVVYNKAKQNPAAAAGLHLTRVEYRAKYAGPVGGLLKMANPLSKVVVFDPGKLSYPDPHRAALRSVGHLQGWRGIVKTFPPLRK